MRRVELRLGQIPFRKNKHGDVKKVLKTGKTLHFAQEFF